jgi:hypothetical protein
LDVGHEAKTWSSMLRTACATCGEETTRLGTVPSCRSMRLLPRLCLAVRSRRQTCGSSPMRCRWPMTGSLPGGDGRRGFDCFLSMSLALGRWWRRQQMVGSSTSVRGTITNQSGRCDTRGIVADASMNWYTTCNKCRAAIWIDG